MKTTPRLARRARFSLAACVLASVAHFSSRFRFLRSVSGTRVDAAGVDIVSAEARGRERPGRANESVAAQTKATGWRVSAAGMRQSGDRGLERSRGPPDGPPPTAPAPLVSQVRGRLAATPGRQTLLCFTTGRALCHAHPGERAETAPRAGVARAEVICPPSEPGSPSSPDAPAAPLKQACLGDTRCRRERPGSPSEAGGPLTALRARPEGAPNPTPSPQAPGARRHPAPCHPVGPHTQGLTLPGNAPFRLLQDARRVAERAAT